MDCRNPDHRDVALPKSPHILKNEINEIMGG